MKRKNITAFGILLLLLLAICIPAFCNALAEGEKRVEIAIVQEVKAYDDKGKDIGTLKLDDSGIQVLFTSSDKTLYSGVHVWYSPQTSETPKTNEKNVGRTSVSLTQDVAVSEGTPTPTPTETSKPLPQSVWIDTEVILAALSAQHDKDLLTVSQLEEENQGLSASLAVLRITPQPTESVQPTSIPEKESAWGFSTGSLLYPTAAIVMGLIGLACLIWIGLSLSRHTYEARVQSKLLEKKSKAGEDGGGAKNAVQVSMLNWPSELPVRVSAPALDRLATAACQNTAMSAMAQVQPSAPARTEPQRPVPEGQETDLLMLVNRLAGVASAAEWYDLVKRAGWRAMLLQSNPTEKGTYVENTSGYSILACLMRSAEAEIAYLLPSYQDPNASEKDWNDFYTVIEDTSVKNYRVEMLAVMHIERGTFFLLKSKGKLTRRPQYY